MAEPFLIWCQQCYDKTTTTEIPVGPAFSNLNHVNSKKVTLISAQVLLTKKSFKAPFYG